ncbi:MAG: methyltransferase domain-containing protein [Lachnospiraceae bacterium]|nr:methyltransferase domain-containing protein [Lachnospiraceae bacterium]
MTRYMKEKLNCKVYIVEYDRPAFEEAIQYAEDGICDDILSLSWVEQFSDIKFDVALFADVLEHLSNPELAMSNVKKILKDEGKVYASIPNVTHNDILLKAFADHFDYTKIGLLDDTHIHFWGYENLAPFANACGLSLLNVEATYCITGRTEQYEKEVLQASPILLNYFNERRCGEIYQFIVTFGNTYKDDFAFETPFVTPCIKSYVYYDDGSDFNERNVYELHSEMVAPGQYLAHYTIKDADNIKRLRFDPVELQGCILQYLSIRQSGRELEPAFNENVEIENGRLLLSNDPMAIVETDPDGGMIVIEADIIIAGEEYEKRVKEACAKKQAEIVNLNGQVAFEQAMRQQEIQRLQEDFAAERARLCQETENLRVEFAAERERLLGEFATEREQMYQETERMQGEFAAEKAHLQRETERLQEELAAGRSQLKSETERLQQENARLQAENGSLSLDLDSYIKLANNKDLQLIECDGAVSEANRRVEEQEHKIQELEQRVTRYQNRLPIKICDIIYVWLWKLKNKLLGRNE